MNYKIIPKESLPFYKDAFKEFNINFKVFPLSFNQQKEHFKESVKIGFSFIHLRQEIDFNKYIRNKYLGSD